MDLFDQLVIIYFKKLDGKTLTAEEEKLLADNYSPYNPFDEELGEDIKEMNREFRESNKRWEEFSKKYLGK